MTNAGCAFALTGRNAAVAGGSVWRRSAWRAEDPPHASLKKPPKGRLEPAPPSDRHHGAGRFPQNRVSVGAEPSQQAGAAAPDHHEVGAQPAGSFPYGLGRLTDLDRNIAWRL